MNRVTEGSLTVVALAWREGEHLAKCFASIQRLVELANAQALVVLDASADPATSKIAQKVSRRVVTNKFESFPRQRNFALDAVTTQWVFFIDADERMTRPLAEEIAVVLRTGTEAAYKVPRRNVFFSKEVRHTGWWPDYQIRLLQVDKCRYNEAIQVHEVPDVQGTLGTLSNPLIHFNYDTWRQFISKQRFYAPREAQALYAAGHVAHLHSFLGQPVREFKRRFVDYKGYKDGVLGLSLSLAMAAYKLLVYWYLYRLNRRRT